MTSSDPSGVSSAAVFGHEQPLPTGRFPRFFYGLGLFLWSLRLLGSERRLWRFALWPMLISLALLVILGVLAVLCTVAIVNAIWPSPAQDWWLILYYVLYITVALVVGLLAYGLFLATSSSLSSPFSEKLSIELERILTGVDTTPAPRSKGEALRSVLSSLWSSLLSLARTVLLALAALLLHLVPLVGSLLSILFTWSIGAFFVAVELIEPIADRREWSTAARRRLVMTNKALFAGLGSALLIATFVPLVNFLSVPVGVIAGTRLFLQLESQKPQPR